MFAGGATSARQLVICRIVAFVLPGRHVTAHYLKSLPSPHLLSCRLCCQLLLHHLPCPHLMTLTGLCSADLSRLSQSPAWADQRRLCLYITIWVQLLQVGLRRKYHHVLVQTLSGHAVQSIALHSQFLLTCSTHSKEFGSK